MIDTRSDSMPFRNLDSQREASGIKTQGYLCRRQLQHVDDGCVYKAERSEYWRVVSAVETRHHEDENIYASITCLNDSQ